MEYLDIIVLGTATFAAIAFLIAGLFCWCCWGIVGE